jgi:sulfide:quinone oxidoreductase
LLCSCCCGCIATAPVSSLHNLQPLWTLVGGGFKDVNASKRPMADVMPAGVDWIRAGAAEFDPDNNKVTTADGRSIKYDYLVVATGMQVRLLRLLHAFAANLPKTCSVFVQKHL